jgi:cyanate permease
MTFFLSISSLLPHKLSLFFSLNLKLKPFFQKKHSKSKQKKKKTLAVFRSGFAFDLGFVFGFESEMVWMIFAGEKQARGFDSVWFLRFGI